MMANLADPALWYGLALKIAMTASIVVAASVVVERSGPFIGSLIAALPTAGGAAMIILALEHSAQFISQSAVGSLIANAACALFALSYAALAQKHGLRLSLGGAFLVWLVTVFLLRLVEWSATGAVILNAVIYPVAIVAAGRYRIPGAVKRVPVTGRRSGLARGGGDALRACRHSGEQLDRLIFLGRFRVFPGGHGFVLHHSAPAHRRAGSRKRRRACADAADRARPRAPGRASARGADRGVVVVRRRPFHRPCLECVALAAAGVADGEEVTSRRGQRFRRHPLRAARDPGMTQRLCAIWIPGRCCAPSRNDIYLTNPSSSALICSAR